MAKKQVLKHHLVSGLWDILEVPWLRRQSDKDMWGEKLGFMKCFDISINFMAILMYNLDNAVILKVQR